MEKYLEILSNTLNQKLLKVESNYLDNYFKIIKKNDFKEILNNNNVWHNAFSEIKKKYQIRRDIHSLGNSNIDINLLKVISAINVIKNKEKKMQLMLLIVYLDCNNILYQFLFNKKFFVDCQEKIFATLNKVTTNSNANNISNLHWESEVFQKYQNGIKKKNIKDIYRFIDHWERGIKFPPPPSKGFINCLVFFLYRLSFENLLQILNKKNDILAIIHLTYCLSIAEKLKIAVESDQLFLKFELLRQVVYKNYDSPALEINEQNLITKIVIDISKDINLWKQFLKFYLHYPASSPNLFQPLGLALNKINNTKIEILIENIIIIDNDFNDKSRQALDSFFLNIQKLNKKKFIGKKIFKRWIEFVNSYDKYTNSILITNAINIVIEHVMSFANKKEINKSIKESIENINEINNQWFNNGDKQRQYFYKQISKLFVYMFAVDKSKPNPYKKELQDILISSLILKYERPFGDKMKTLELFTKYHQTNTAIKHAEIKK